MKNTILLCAAWAGFLFNAHAADFPKAKSNNWHHWRGPEANGIALTAKPPTKWSEEKNVRWKAPIEGFGTSTPIIWGNKVFLLTAINTGKVDPSLPRPEDQPKRVFDITHPNTTYEFVVLCLDRKTGKTPVSYTHLTLPTNREV